MCDYYLFHTLLNFFSNSIFHYLIKPPYFGKIHILNQRKLRLVNEIFIEKPFLLEETRHSYPIRVNNFGNNQFPLLLYLGLIGYFEFDIKL